MKARATWAAAVAVVFAIYGIVAGTAASELGSRNAGEDYYNRLAAGLAAGHLWLDLAPPPALAALANPYDAAANAPFHGQMYLPGRIHDVSYYRGRFYLYFSVVPAVVLFLPFHALTGAYLSHQSACGVFSGLGFLAAAILIESIRRRCFPRAGTVAAGVALLCAGLVPVVPIVLQRPDVWEVPITASYMFWMLTLLALWLLPGPRGRAWLPALGASAAAGLAIGCRPNSCLGAAILLPALWRALRNDAATRRQRAALVAALTLPIAGIGLALLGYNHARFGSILEFGQRYQLTQEPEGLFRHFQPGFFWYNFRLYFLGYPGWQGHFPFVQDGEAPGLPAGHLVGDNPVGALGVLPFLLCAAAVPRILRQPSGEPGGKLRSLAGAALMLFAAGAGPLCLYFGTCVRYQLEFLPALTLLAVIGFFGLVSGPIPGWRRAAWRTDAGAAAGGSIAFNLLTAVNHRSGADTQHAMVVMHAGPPEPAEPWFRRALRLRPGNVAARVGLAEVLAREQRFPEAVVEFARVEAADPESPTLHLHYAYCLYHLGRREAAAECAWALRLQPDYPEAQAFAQALARGP